VPKVVFVNEHRIVEAAAGSRVRDVAREAGVAIDAKRFRGVVSCGGLGVCRACLCWVEESAPGAAGPRSLIERLRGLRGWRRLGCRAKVLGDLKVYSVPAAANRVGQPRLIAPPPSPVRDPAAPRKPDDAASTAAHIHGHPSAVGRGLGPAIGKNEVPPPPPSHANAARPISTAPPPADDDEPGL
jgi:ferredoxin